MLVAALLLKIGAAPLHQWVITVAPRLSWQSFFILIVPQKIAPILLFSILNPYAPLNLVYFFVVVRALVGSIGGLVVVSLKKIITYSSISHLSWLIVRITIDKYLWFIYFFIYSFILSTVIFSFHKINIKNLSQIFFIKKNISKNILILNILSLGGLPPFSGFMGKIAVLSSLVASKKILIALFILSATIIRLFFYLRVVTANIFSTNSKIRHTQAFTPPKTHIITFVNAAGLLVIYPMALLLDFKLYKLKAFKALKKKIS